MIGNTKLCRKSKTAINRSSVKRCSENIAWIKIIQVSMETQMTRIRKRALLITTLTEKQNRQDDTE